MNINITVSLGLALGWTGISYGDRLWPSDPVTLLFTTCILLQNNKPEVQKSQNYNIVISGSCFCQVFIMQICTQKQHTGCFTQVQI